MVWILRCTIEKEGGRYVSLCSDLDIASQGDTPDEARDNLEEALNMFFEDASDIEIMDVLSRIKPESRPKIQQRPSLVSDQDSQGLGPVELELAYA